MRGFPHDAPCAVKAYPKPRDDRAIGGGFHVLQQLLGHATLLMTQRYAPRAGCLVVEVTRLDFSAPVPAEVTSTEDARRKRDAN